MKKTIGAILILFTNMLLGQNSVGTTTGEKLAFRSVVKSMQTIQVNEINACHVIDTLKNPEAYLLRDFENKAGTISIAIKNQDEYKVYELFSENIIFDPTLMHHYIGYELYSNMGNYSSRSKFVEVELNGVYIGVYVLMEKLKRGTDRINIESLSSSDTDAGKITGGYILKIDKTSGSDVLGTHPLAYYDNNWDDDCRYTEFNSFRSNYDINRNLITFPAYGAPYNSTKYLETYFVYD